MGFHSLKVKCRQKQKRNLLKSCGWVFVLLSFPPLGDWTVDKPGPYQCRTEPSWARSSPFVILRDPNMCFPSACAPPCQVGGGLLAPCSPGPLNRPSFISSYISGFSARINPISASPSAAPVVSRTGGRHLEKGKRKKRGGTSGEK